jgi:uncharacterized protein
MNNRSDAGAGLMLGVFIFAGLLGLGYQLADGFLQAKALERTVTVKGLSEREVPADIAIWPIKYNQADNDLVALYAAIERHNGLVVEFLKQRGFGDDEISVSVPAIVDRQAQAYGGEQNARFRYAATSSITVYSTNVERVRATMNDLVELGKQGLAIAGQDYEARTQFLFTGLNALKPAMIEEATRTRAKSPPSSRRTRRARSARSRPPARASSPSRTATATRRTSRRCAWCRRWSTTSRIDRV